MKNQLVFDRKLHLDYGVLGRVYVDYIAKGGERKRDHLGEMFCIERGWHNNAVGMSCIPAGVYRLKRETGGRNYPIFSKRWGHKFLIELVGVSGRTEIQVHPASNSQQLQGCIAPVRLPRIGQLQKAGRWTHPDEVIKTDKGRQVKVIAGTGWSRRAYCDIYEAVIRYDIKEVVVDSRLCDCG